MEDVAGTTTRYTSSLLSNLLPKSSTPNLKALIRIESQESSVDLTDRTCAFCLDRIPRDKIIRCTGCQKRDYCSQEHFEADWALNQGGQGHSQWCNLSGEEGIDWEVKQIDEKGRGIVAKRRLPKYFKILVDAWRDESHPGVEDLYGATPAARREQNRFLVKGPDGTEEYIYCLKISRINHSCDANAGHITDGISCVEILFAERDIEENEEITIRYIAFNSLVSNVNALFFPLWGFFCPIQCLCQDKKIQKVREESINLLNEIVGLAQQGDSSPDGTQGKAKVEKLMRNHEVMKSSAVDKKQTLVYALQMAVMKKATVDLAQEYAGQLFNIYTHILRKEDPDLVAVERWMCNPMTHPYYLKLEPKQDEFRLVKVIKYEEGYSAESTPGGSRQATPTQLAPDKPPYTYETDKVLGPTGQRFRKASSSESIDDFSRAAKKEKKDQ